MINEFEWDEEKRQQNIDLHGVDFRFALQIFQNPMMDRQDDRTDYGEPRFRALGFVGEDYYLVAYTWRRNVRRIISAWRVGEDGKRRYQAILNGPD